MSEYWKSTPSYWCKFCKDYVRDTGIERKNHEASFKHQNNIQRSLRTLHNEKAREDRDKARAKDEVARLNGLVGGKASATSKAPSANSGSKMLRVTTVSAGNASGTAPVLSAAAQRKAHAEQLLAMGVQIPEELKKEVTGIGTWQAVSEKVFDDGAASGRSLADIMKEETKIKDESKIKGAIGNVSQKRKGEEEVDEDIPGGRSRKTWGSSLKTFPGSRSSDNDQELDALLSGVKKRRSPPVEDRSVIKSEDESKPAEQQTRSDHAEDSPVADIKDEASASLSDLPPPVVFKKRKIKR